jgi:hypothetical protein
MLPGRSRARTAINGRLGAVCTGPIAVNVCDQATACSHAKSASEAPSLPLLDGGKPPAAGHTDAPGERRRKLKGGLRTPEAAFYIPILHALTELGGTGRTADVVQRVGEIMAETLSPNDREPLPSTGLPRWKKTTQFAKHSMVRSGLLKSDSPRGVWEIVNTGADCLRQSRAG